MKADERERQQKDDMAFLGRRPEFLRFLWRSIQNAGIFTPANGSEGRRLEYFEGRRSLGFDLLHDAEQGQPSPHPDALLTLFQVMHEEAQQSTSEKPNAKPYRRIDELAADADRADAADAD